MKFRVLMLAALLGSLATSAVSQNVLTAKLLGRNETPSVVSTGVGQAKITISDDEHSITYTLTYSGLQGATDFVSNPPGTPGTVLFAHIHVGQRNVAGGVVVFFCGGGNTPATQVKCPGPTSGTVSGTWTAADLRSSALSQGIDPSDPNGENAFARFIHAIRTGISYANVHTSRSPGGEIRGQFVPVRDDDADDDRDH